MNLIGSGYQVNINDTVYNSAKRVEETKGSAAEFIG